MNLQDWLVVVTGAAYAISTIGYASNFKKEGVLRARFGTWGLITGWGIHTVLLAILTVDAGQVPLTSQTSSSLCAWLVVIVLDRPHIQNVSHEQWNPKNLLEVFARLHPL